MANGFIEPAWYALQVRSRIEKSIQTQLESKGYETFLPTHVSSRQWSDRVKSITLPLFPGYVFCRFAFDARLPVVITPGVHLVVGKVDDDEIRALRLVLDSRLHAQPWPYLATGEAVRICRGPLKDLVGIVLRSGGADRLILSVSLLMRSVSVEIDRESIQPLGSLNWKNPFRKAS